MPLKDYYTILEVTPVATLQEIKRSFRRLALQYHPDKNSGDHLSEARFKEVREAYEILSDPKQREEYNYKRWYNRSTGGSFTYRPLTPAGILAAAEQLRNYVRITNIFQVDHNALSFHIRQLLDESSIGILRQAGEPGINRQIVDHLLQAAGPLPLRYCQPIVPLLEELAGNDNATITTIRRFMKEKKLRAQWDSYKWLVVLLLIVLICWLMVAVAG